MKRMLLAANWKTHHSPAGAFAPASPYLPSDLIDVIVLPQNDEWSAALAAGCITGAQHVPIAGSVSMQQIEDMGLTYVLCGHSDRRTALHETDIDIAAQVEEALKFGLTPILCIGETQEQRSAGNPQEVVRSQLASIELHPEIVIAYEPVWAIGTGKNATPAQVQEMHAVIRNILPDSRMRILYGGSLSSSNARDILLQPDVDGGLVGGASLKPEEFAAIRKVMEAVAAEKKGM